jgi:hypothetical protein
VRGDAVAFDHLESLNLLRATTVAAKGNDSLHLRVDLLNEELACGSIEISAMGAKQCQNPREETASIFVGQRRGGGHVHFAPDISTVVIS